MAQAGKDASPAGGAVRYARHRPENTLLYQLVDEYYPALADQMAARGTPLPEYVQREFEDYLKCGRLEHGFLRVRCESCHAEHLVAFSCKHPALLVDEVLPETPMRQWVLSFPFPLRFLFASRPEIMGRALGIVYRVLSTHLIRKAGFTHKSARTGAVTLIQRFGGALNLNVHLMCMDARMPWAHGCAGAAHMLFLDGVYVDDAHSGTRFRWVKAPTSAELTHLTHTIAHRVSRFLERQGLLVRDDETAYLDMDTEGDDPMAALIGHSVTYRIATGPRQGRKVLTLQTLPAIDESFTTRVGNVAGFSLHAGVAAKANEREKVRAGTAREAALGHKLERLCRYITRPAISEKRLSLTNQGKVRYELKTPYRDGTTHVIFEPVDFIAKLAALVPKPRVNLTRFHGVFAPNSKHRALVTPAGRGKGSQKVAEDQDEKTPAQRHVAMTWAQRLKRVFANSRRFRRY
jgi:hypothetical protein